jgi:hypothetical protein
VVTPVIGAALDRAIAARNLELAGGLFGIGARFAEWLLVRIDIDAMLVHLAIDLRLLLLARLAALRRFLGAAGFVIGLLHLLFSS